MDKDIVFIVSGGRTGTAFFGAALGEAVEDCFSVHEPDLLVDPLKFGFRKILQQLRTFGVSHMILDRLRGESGVRNLAQQYLSGAYDQRMDVLVKKIHQHRDRYFAHIEQSLIVESNYQWFGLLPGLRRAYPKAKVVGVIRDPREWVRSAINFGGRRDDRDMVERTGQQRITPAMIGDHEWEEHWGALSTFEKLCWDWKTIYGLIDDFAQCDDACRLYRYEDVFDLDDADTLKDLLRFIATHPDRTYDCNLSAPTLSQRRNASVGDADPWARWTPKDATFLQTMCGPLMNKYGYGAESAWRNLTAANAAPAASVA